MIRNIIRYRSPAIIFVALTTCILFSTPAYSADQETTSTQANGKQTDTNQTDADQFETAQADNDEADMAKPVVSIAAMDDDQASGDSLGLAATYAEHNERNPEKALLLARRALEKDDDNIDLHVHYVELLEKKLKGSPESDPGLYTECVKEWLMILRNEIGDEKGLTFHGIGLPFTGQFYEDEDRGIIARKHLIKLTGIAPHGWETDAKYLKKVLERSSVKGKILSKDAQEDPDTIDSKN